MKIAIIGSRKIKTINLEKLLCEWKNIDEIISGGSKGIDTCARNYALAHNLKLTEFLPDYKRYGRKAPLIRNNQIIASADEVIAIWDGKSAGTKYVIEQCKKLNKKITIVIMMKKMYPNMTE